MNNLELTFLDWDSVFFDMKIYRLNLNTSFALEDLQQKMQEVRGDFVYIFSSKELTLPAYSPITLVDKKVTFAKAIEKHSYVNSNISSAYQNSEDLLQLALLSGKYSRFRLDSRLTSKFEEMYTTWLTKSLAREIASEVFVYTEDADTLGFVTLKADLQKASIGLVAVDENHQGKKIGSSLLKTCERWCVEHLIPIIEVPTQLDNIQACEFYKSNGYEIKQLDYIYHYATR